VSRTFFRLVAAAALATLAGACPALTQERTPGGLDFVVGGIGAEEVAAIESLLASSPYSLALRTAAHGSGAYLADVDVTIEDGAGRQVFQRRLDGPYLLIDLPPGRYVIVGVREGQVQRISLDLPRQGRRSLVMYFIVEGEIRPHANDQD